MPPSWPRRPPRRTGGLADKPRQPWFAATRQSACGALPCRGLVEPVDDVRHHQPPSNPERSTPSPSTSWPISMTQGANPRHQASRVTSSRRGRTPPTSATGRTIRAPCSAASPRGAGATWCRRDRRAGALLGAPPGTRRSSCGQQSADYFLKVFGRPDAQQRGRFGEWRARARAGRGTGVAPVNAPEVQGKLSHARGAGEIWSSAIRRRAARRANCT